MLLVKLAAAAAELAVTGIVSSIRPVTRSTPDPVTWAAIQASIPLGRGAEAPSCRSSEEHFGAGAPPPSLGE